MRFFPNSIFFMLIIFSIVDTGINPEIEGQILENWEPVHKLQIVLVVCREKLEWVQKFSSVEASLLVYSKCGELEQTTSKYLSTLGAVVRNGAPSSNPLHTYVYDMIERKQSTEISMNISYVYMRPSVFFGFTRLQKPTRQFSRRPRFLFIPNEELTKIKIHVFFAALTDLSKRKDKLKNIGFMEFADKNQTAFNCKATWKREGFPKKVSKQWRKDSLPCTFESFKSNHFLISSKFLKEVSLPLLIEVAEALEDVEARFKKTGVYENFFPRMLERSWDAMMGCALTKRMNFCDNCGVLQRVGGVGVERIAHVMESISSSC